MSFLLNEGCNMRFCYVWFNSETIRSVVFSVAVGVLSWFSRCFTLVSMDVV
jgi:hypothetical protein